MIRPVRIGLLAETRLSSIIRAAEVATTAWGGIFTPVLPSRPRELVLQISEALGVDALFPLDDSSESESLTALPGFQWGGRSPWGPYDEPQEHMSSRLLGPEWLIERLPESVRPFLPRWEPGDPLSQLFAVWFGHYGEGDYARALESAVAERGEVIDIAPAGPLTIPDGVSPIALTGSEIAYSGYSSMSGVVVVNPIDPVDLGRFWNERASGGEVFPWPLGHDERVKDQAEAWLADRAESGALSRWHRGDGSLLPPQAQVLLPPGVTEVPSNLIDVLTNAGVTPLVNNIAGLPMGWTGMHPFQTEFERSFSIDFDKQSWTADIPLPEFPPARIRDKVTSSMVIVAEISLYGENGLGSTRTAQVPNLRDMAGTSASCSGSAIECEATRTQGASHLARSFR